MSEKKIKAEILVTLNVTRTFYDSGVDLEDQAQEYGVDLANAFQRMSDEETEIDWNDVTVLNVNELGGESE